MIIYVIGDDDDDASNWTQRILFCSRQIIIH